MSSFKILLYLQSYLHLHDIEIKWQSLQFHKIVKLQVLKPWNSHQIFSDRHKKFEIPVLFETTYICIRKKTSLYNCQSKLGGHPWRLELIVSMLRFKLLFPSFHADFSTRSALGKGNPRRKSATCHQSTKKKKVKVNYIYELLYIYELVITSKL